VQPDSENSAMGHCPEAMFGLTGKSISWWLLLLTLPILSCGQGARSLTAASPTGPALTAAFFSPTFSPLNG